MTGLDAIETASRDEIAALQRERLAWSLRHAYTNVAHYRAAFDKQYRGKRIPLVLSFHFTPMNNGAYWDALERFADQTCVRSDVECISFRDYVQRQSGGQIQASVGG